MFDHAGLLLNRPPGNPGCLSFSHPTLGCTLFSILRIGTAKTSANSESWSRLVAICDAARIPPLQIPSLVPEPSRLGKSKRALALLIRCFLGLANGLRVGAGHDFREHQGHVVKANAVRLTWSEWSALPFCLAPGTDMLQHRRLLSRPGWPNCRRTINERKKKNRRGQIPSKGTRPRRLTR